jgi:hypothetical protein
MELPAAISRRSFLARASVGSLALGGLLNPLLFKPSANAAGDRWPGILPRLHFPAKAKRVIWLTMAGGPSHLETFDYKPKLRELDGKEMPGSFTKGQQLAQLQGQKLNCFGPRWDFKKFGKSGAEICELFPHLGSVADEITFIRSMHTEAINHDPAHCFINTGSAIPGRPSMGSWLTYGLGTETEELPGFVVMTSLGQGGQNQPIAARQWSAGFLPSRFQGVHLRGKGDAVLYLSNPAGIGRSQQEDIVNAVKQLDARYDSTVHDPEISTRISQYEMAFRMQASVPGLMDMSAEPEHIRTLYGCEPGDGSFASNCLQARRLAERGVRFIQLYHKDWDHHGDVKNGVKQKAAEVDRACMALITDLKQRGMLDDTLIVWAGEFGRTPMSQGDGRDHHMLAYSIWMAGGGIKGGVQWGTTDELGYKPADNPVHVHDVHATMLHLLGIDHTKLTYRQQGRDYRLTDVFGKVINPILV